jgi:hypothetical protein
MVAIRLVVITAIIVLVQVLGLCVAAPINPLPGASLNSWNGAASRVEKNEGTTLLMRRAPCFGNLCGKTDEERSSSLPSLPDPGRKERGDKFMAKVRGAIKGGWKGAGDVIGKAWDSAATGTRNALDFVTGGFNSGTVSRTPSRPKKAGQAKKAGQSNPAGPSLWTNPPTQRQNYGSLSSERGSLSSERPAPTTEDLVELRNRLAAHVKTLQKDIDQADQRLSRYGSLEHWDPKKYEEARADRSSKEEKQLRMRQWLTKGETLNLPGSATNPYVGSNQQGNVAESRPELQGPKSKDGKSSGDQPLETHTQREHPASWPGSPGSGRSGDDSIASAPVGGKKEPKRPKGVKSASEWKGKADTGIKAKDKAEVNRGGNESPEKGRSIPKEGKCLTYPRSVD